MMHPKIILGSSSKWRKSILADMGYEFTTMSPDIDEKAIRDPDPEQLTLKLARAKAQALLSKVHEPAILITSDQVITFNGAIREKPENADECRQFLRSYNETNPAVAICGVVVINTATGRSAEGVAVAKQYFTPLSEHKIESLIAQGDVLWCCGGFAIELMEEFLDRREGEVETIIGLPRTLTESLIQQVK